MLLQARVTFIASHVQVRDGKTYANANLENSDSVVEVAVDERLVPELPSIKKYQEYDAVFSYEKISTQKGAFTMFRLCDLKSVQLTGK